MLHELLYLTTSGEDLACKMVDLSTADLICMDKK